MYKLSTRIGANGVNYPMCTSIDGIGTTSTAAMGTKGALGTGFTCIGANRTRNGT